MDGRKRVKRGYTLIECIAYIFISSLLTMIIINTTLDAYKYSILRAELVNREDAIDNAILNIKKILNESDNISYIVKNNKIEIIKEFKENNNLERDLKKLEVVDGNLRVKYYVIDDKYTEFKMSNLILNDVEEFNVYVKKNLLYAELKVDEREYLICL